MEATIRKEIPARKRSPVGNQTTIVMMAAGKMEAKFWQPK